ncbi:hypothetical protein JCM5353_003934 [Sporobolomyces roseus]
MFHISTPFDYSPSAPSPFAHFPSSSISSVDPFLPPSYASYDEERSRIEQALLARKQQERRQAGAAAFLAEQRRLERQAVIEEAIREERERREYERALKYREEMVRRAREEEEVKQRYIQAMRVQQELTRREQEEQRRRIERATEQRRQIDQSSSLDTVPDLFQLLFGDRSTQDYESPRPTEPVATPQPSTPSPVQTQPSRSEQPQLDLPHFLEAIFGTPQPSTTTKQASPTPQQAPAPVSQSAPSPSAQTSSSPSPSPASPLASVAPSSIPIVHQETPADSPSFDEEEDAATKVQRQFRRHLARRNALDKISSLSSSFLDRQSNFEKPSTLTFKESSPDSTSSTTTPSLAFVSSNSPFLAYEDYLVNLLSKIDAVESGGDKVVKQERKSLVRKVEKELSRLDAMKERAWEEQVKAAKSDSVKEDEKEVDATAETKEDCATSSEPPTASNKLNDDDDDTLTPLLPLTHDAVSSLPTSTPLSHSRSPSDSGSSSTSSTLTVSSASSQVDQYISEMLRRAQKLGEQVEKMELEEMSKLSEQVETV